MVTIREDEPVQKRVYKNIKVWSFLAGMPHLFVVLFLHPTLTNLLIDVEESLGTFQTTKAVYDKIIELRVATPHIILNYAAWLEEHKHFEEAFKAYEKGVALFNFPYVHDIFTSPPFPPPLPLSPSPLPPHLSSLFLTKATYLDLVLEQVCQEVWWNKTGKSKRSL